MNWKYYTMLSLSFESSLTPLNWRKRNRGWVYRGDNTYMAFKEITREKNRERRISRP